MNSLALNYPRVSTCALARLFLVASAAAALWRRCLLRRKGTLSFTRSPIERFPLLNTARLFREMVIDVAVPFTYSGQTYLFQDKNLPAEPAPELHLSLLPNPLFMAHFIDDVVVLEFVGLSEML